MQRLLAGMVIALGCHALLLMVPIQYHPAATRSRPLKTGGITVGFSRIESIAPRKEVRSIPPPPPRQAKKMTPVVSAPRQKPLSPQADTPPSLKKKSHPPRPEVKEGKTTITNQPQHPDPFPPVSPSKIGKETRHPLAAPEPTVGMIDKNKVSPQVSQAYPESAGNPPPKYPVLARRRGWQGTVHLSVLVLENGKVGDITIVKTSGYPILDETALKAVTRYRFIPGRQGDQPVAMRVRVPVDFRLQDAK